jgi:energy-coupling factor transport system ATP-binding protein
MSLIQLKNVSYKYPVGKSDVLKDVNVEIEKGGFYALIGANGSGKTTFCNVLRGFVPHFYKGDLRGDVLIDGKDIREWDMGELAQKIGFVFQNPFTQISGVKETVFEEIAFGLENLGIDVDVIIQKVEEVIDLLGIDYLREKNPQELSGGQKQRVALASIIVMEPEILVVDEPTSQLDPRGTEDIFKIIELMKLKGKTIILAEHKIELIAEKAEKILVFKDGKVVMQGAVEEILTNQRVQEYGAALPQYALLGLEMKKRNWAVDRIPLTEQQAIATVKGLIHAKGGQICHS